MQQGMDEHCDEGEESTEEAYRRIGKRKVNRVGKPHNRGSKRLCN